MQAMSKTAVLAKLPIKPDAKDTFLDAFGAMLEAVESEEGTEIYILNWGQNDDENTAYIYELYADGDALPSQRSDAMKALMGALVVSWPARQSSSCSRRLPARACSPARDLSRPDPRGTPGVGGCGHPIPRRARRAVCSLPPARAFGLRWPERIRSP